MAPHVHQALAQVRQLKLKVLESRWFRGYSGKARAFSGSLALVCAGVLSLESFPRRPREHVVMWGVVFVAAMGANTGAVVRWFLSDPSVKRDHRRLLPTVDSLLPIMVGGVLTLAMIMRGQYEPLFGIWMCLFGLANLSARWVMPWAVWVLGLYYVACGTAYLLAPGVAFTDPWPMGIVFFIGEWSGGVIFHYSKKRNATLREFFME